MERKDYNGKTFDYVAIPTFTQGGMGTMFMFKNTDGEYCLGDVRDCNFWMKEFDDGFQNMEHLSKGLEYVDAMPDSVYKQKILDVLESMKGHTGGQKFSQQIGFFCELGCWEDEDARQPRLYDSDFFKYVKKCLNEYEDYILIQ